MITHEEIQEMIQKILPGKIDDVIVKSVIGGYTEHMKKKIVLPNTGSGFRLGPGFSSILKEPYKEAMRSGSGAMKIEYDEGSEEKDLARRRINCINENGEQETILVNFQD